MEAKRLPTPGQNRQKEYVIGYNKPCGGIVRFKKGIHGKGLKFAAIIGYIQEQNSNYWFIQINEWIGELIINLPTFWKKDDKLIQDIKPMTTLSKFTSKNFRKLDDEPEDYIYIFHFWINLIE